jgi:hypothetical protein
MVDVKMSVVDKIPNIGVAHDWVTFRKCLALGRGGHGWFISC